MIYLDNMATTPIDPRVLEVYTTALTTLLGNPSARYHSAGERCYEEIEKVRKRIGASLGIRPSEIYFVPSATVANNIALLGVASFYSGKKSHILLSAIEHASVLECAPALRAMGYDVEIIPCNTKGIVEPDQVKRMLRPTTLLVSVMAVNNEIGTIQPVEEIAKEAKQNGSLFHCDASQALGKTEVSALKDADILTFSSHKAYGPLGVACLALKSHVRLKPLTFGGKQERGVWAGTENYHGIVAFGKAFDLAVQEWRQDAERILVLGKMLTERIFDIFPGSWRNGDPERSVPHCLSITFQGIAGELLFQYLARKGIIVSFGSACASLSGRKSHVLSAIGLGDEEQRRTLRIALSRFTKEDEIAFVCEVLEALRR